MGKTKERVHEGRARGWVILSPRRPTTDWGAHESPTLFTAPPGLFSTCWLAGLCSIPSLVRKEKKPFPFSLSLSLPSNIKYKSSPTVFPFKNFFFFFVSLCFGFRLPPSRQVLNYFPPLSINFPSPSHSKQRKKMIVLSLKLDETRTTCCWGMFSIWFFHSSYLVPLKVPFKEKVLKFNAPQKMRKRLFFVVWAFNRHFSVPSNLIPFWGGGRPCKKGSILRDLVTFSFFLPPSVHLARIIDGTTIRQGPPRSDLPPKSPFLFV